MLLDTEGHAEAGKCSRQFAKSGPLRVECPKHEQDAGRLESNSQNVWPNLER